MLYGFIVERLSYFEIGEYYAIVSNDDEIIDTFLCTNLDTAAKHYLTYTVRGCEIWRYFEKDECDDKLDELLYKRDEFYQLFANGRRSCKRNLGLCCELSHAMNRFKKIFKSKKG